MENEITPSLTMSARIWWNITWKTMVFGIPFSFVGGFLGAMIGLIATGGNDDLANTIGSVCSGLAVIPIAILVIKSTLNETFGQYRICYIKVSESENLNDTNALDPSIS